MDFFSDFLEFARNNFVQVQPLCTVAEQQTMKFIIVATLFGLAAAGGCPNECSGRGTCNYWGQCTCYQSGDFNHAAWYVVLVIFLDIVTLVRQSCHARGWGCTGLARIAPR